MFSLVIGYYAVYQLMRYSILPLDDVTAMGVSPKNLSRIPITAPRRSGTDSEKLIGERES